MDSNRQNIKDVIVSNKSPKPFGSYSKAIKCGNLLFISGQLPIAANNAKIEIDGMFICKN